MMKVRIFTALTRFALILTAFASIPVALATDSEPSDTPGPIASAPAEEQDPTTLAAPQDLGTMVFEEETVASYSDDGMIPTPSEEEWVTISSEEDILMPSSDQEMTTVPVEPSSPESEPEDLSTEPSTPDLDVLAAPDVADAERPAEWVEFEVEPGESALVDSAEASTSHAGETETIVETEHSEETTGEPGISMPAVPLADPSTLLPEITIDAEAHLDSSDTDPEATDDAFEAMAVAKASESVTDAIAWAHSIGDEDRTFQALRVIAYEAARSDPITSLTLASQLPPSPQTDSVLAHAVSQWAAVDATSAAQWAQATDTPELRQLLLAHVAVGMAEQDAKTAAGLVATMLQPGQDQDSVAVSVVERWAQIDPEQCAAWISLFSDSPVQQQAAEELVSIWGQQDASAVGRWITTLPAGPLREPPSAACKQLGARRGRRITGELLRTRAAGAFCVGPALQNCCGSASKIACQAFRVSCSMDWQQLVALSVVATTAVLFAWTKFRKRVDTRALDAGAQVP
jgi:hypothetical protein